MTIKEILSTLVEIPTTSDNYAANHEGLEFIDRFLAERGMVVRRYENNGFESLVATTHKTKTPTVMLAAHLDVVPGPAEIFKLTEESGKYSGRGVLDMKFAIACYLNLVENLQAAIHEYDFGIMITTDEEEGGQNGTSYLLSEGYVPQVCVLPDGGSDWAIEESAKGIKYAEVTTSGVSAHGSRPWLGDSAILKILKIIEELQAYFTDAGPDTRTINIGQISGGEAPNQVPETASIKIDIRTISKEESQQINAKLEEICNKYDASLTMRFDDPPCRLDLNNPLVSQFTQCLQNALGYDPGTTHSLGGSDARYLAAHDVPCIVVYPPGGGHHAGDEWIEATEVERFGEILEDYITKVTLKSVK